MHCSARFDSAWDAPSARTQACHRPQSKTSAQVARRAVFASSGIPWGSARQNGVRRKERAFPTGPVPDKAALSVSAVAHQSNLFPREVHEVGSTIHTDHRAGRNKAHVSVVGGGSKLMFMRSSSSSIAPLPPSSLRLFFSMTSALSIAMPAEVRSSRIWRGSGLSNSCSL